MSGPETVLLEEHARILEDARRDFAGAASAGADAFEAARVKYLGRKGGAVQAQFDLLKTVSSERKRDFGRSANVLRGEIEKLVEETKRASAGASSRAASAFDITLPGREGALSRKHVMTQTLELLVESARSLGFSVAEGPEAEFEHNNFDALNIPLEHPAYDPFDTFYLRTAPGEPKLVLRSHTSPVQVRAMRAATGGGPDADGPALRMVMPGRVYRPDKVDATHYHTFHQMEGIAVDQGITFADLRYTLEIFIQNVFGRKLESRFRPSYFPFTEPSAEMDISCPFCGDASACPVCKGSAWIEILGCGMIHPNVLKAGGYDPERVTGFAFGMGIERVAILRHGIRDIRLFLDPERGNDLRFLGQF